MEREDMDDALGFDTEHNAHQAARTLVSAYERAGIPIPQDHLSHIQHAWETVHSPGLGQSALATSEMATIAYCAGFLMSRSPETLPKVADLGIGVTVARLEDILQSAESIWSLFCEWTRLHSDAVSLYRRGANAEAVRILTTVVQACPVHVQAAYDLAVTLHASAQYARALCIYEAVLLLRPEDHQARNNRAILLASTAKHDEAIEEFRELVATEHAAVMALENLAILYKAIGKDDDAMQALLEARELDPSNARLRELELEWSGP